MDLEGLSRDQLRRMVEVLREACEEWRGSAVTSYDHYGAALVAEADRIAAEPRQLTDREVVEGFAVSQRGAFGVDITRYGVELIVCGIVDNVTSHRVIYEDIDTAYSAAAAWVREQGER